MQIPKTVLVFVLASKDLYSILEDSITIHN